MYVEGVEEVFFQGSGVFNLGLNFFWLILSIFFSIMDLNVKKSFVGMKPRVKTIFRSLSMVISEQKLNKSFENRGFEFTK